MAVYLKFTFTLAVLIASSGPPARGQAPEWDRSVFLGEDSMNVRYYLLSIQEWDDMPPSRLSGQWNPGGEVVRVFRFSLNSSYVMSYNEFGLPLHYDTISGHYGCLVRTPDGITVYTGEVGTEWNAGAGKYVETLGELSPEGPLQQFLGAEEIVGYLGPERKTAVK